MITSARHWRKPCSVAFSGASIQSDLRLKVPVSVETLEQPSRFQFFTKFEAWNSLRRFFHEEKAPQGLNFNKFLQTLQGMTDKRYGRGKSEEEGFTYKTLMLAGMHFMDSYNYDVERVKRCIIHYAAPNGLIYPFCAYNSGPVYRERIEKQFSVPFEEQEEMRLLTLKGKKSCATCVSEPELVG
jgi:uncharacterized radical SAM superfamily Fe-S cluster-containing enzyme